MISEPIDGHEHCPLCHGLVNQNKWREHLMGDQPCKNNPRNKIGKSCKLDLRNYFDIKYLSIFIGKIDY